VAAFVGLIAMKKINVTMQTSTITEKFVQARVIAHLVAAELS